MWVVRGVAFLTPHALCRHHMQLHHIQQQQQQQERQAASKPSPSPSPHAQARAATPPLKRRGSESAGGSDATTQLLLQDVLARLATVEQRAEVRAYTAASPMFGVTNTNHAAAVVLCCVDCLTRAPRR